MTASAPALVPDLTAGLRRLKLARIRAIASNCAATPCVALKTATRRPPRRPTPLLVPETEPLRRPQMPDDTLPRLPRPIPLGRATLPDQQ